ncbi:MAG: metal ABC transporter ATP-binding protein [Planctomycetes bacterium]|jgi:ABC-type Mn2+/Zn2+ transport system ATPase subunit|nr:metal ABC transporter ATP-binding protein [Planctomycetota bacterium]MBT4027886.1 metal ABC transporter ATP-binding protein [Planctomycetota bacterium]MBT4560001.1 metal ABC transporter ATP-binding protein [Planctomycetota bacterium]MBT5120627.1 metal ABC transporter ATP-binding protein [Planctomycetota bacterium]MBT7012021.1 metal ABC transporter ATP-binding protein [Planctomycetota bacterium]
MSLLSLHAADLGYRGRAVLRQVSFSVSAGDWHILHGANGAGKSTFLRSMVGSLPLVCGRRDISDGLRLASLPQAASLDAVFPLTVTDVVKMGLWHGKKLFQRETDDDRVQIATNLKRVGLETYGTRLFAELSGGQKQRVLLARAMCAKPQVLILDEPTTALDMASRRRYDESLRELRDGGTALVIATHEHEGWPSDSRHWVIGDGGITHE